jgi:hypothetical protein
LAAAVSGGVAMNKKIIISVLFLMIAVLLIPAVYGVHTALADSGYQINWWTIDGGGGESAGGDYTLKGTIGQPDTGSAEGGDYTLAGGFWVEGILDLLEYIIHLPLVLK